MPYFDFILPTENTPLPMNTRNCMLEHRADSFPLMMKTIFFHIFSTDRITKFDSTPEHTFPVCVMTHQKTVSWKLVQFKNSRLEDSHFSV